MSANETATPGADAVQDSSGSAGMAKSDVCERGAAPDQSTVLLVGLSGRCGQDLESALRTKGSRVLVVENSEVALSACNGHAVDVVVAARDQTGLSGLELHDALRVRSGPPVVMMIGWHSPAEAAWLLERGIADCVSSEDSPAVIAARCAAVARRQRVQAGDRRG